MLKLLPILALASGLALAGPLSQTVTCTPVGPVPTELSGTLVCPQFNPLLGVLSSVTITVTGQIDGTITLTNGATSNQSLNATESSTFKPGPLGSGLSFASFIASFSFATVNQVPGSQTSGPLSSGPVAGPAATSSLAADLAFVTAGGGFFNIPVVTTSTFTCGGGGGAVGCAQTTKGTATASVTYMYGSTTTPEPTTVSLIGLGLLGVGLLRKKSSRR